MTNLATDQHNTPSIDPQDTLTLSGYGFRMVIRGNGEPQIFNNENQPVTDLIERIFVQKKFAGKLQETLIASLQKDLVNASEAVAEMSHSFTHPFPANDNAPKTLKPGDQVEDGSYYMGVSDTTGTDFFLFLESVCNSKHADVVSFNKGTEIMRQKHEQKAELHGHKFSAQQLENEIVTAQNDGTADGGIRRLTRAEWKQVKTVFNRKQKLRKAALEICKKDNWVQTATRHDDLSVWFYMLDGCTTNTAYDFVDSSLLVGRSLPQPKP